MVEKLKVKKGEEEIELSLDETESTKAKKIFKGTDSYGNPIKHISLDMQPKNKEEK